MSLISEIKLFCVLGEVFWKMCQVNPHLPYVFSFMGCILGFSRWETESDKLLLNIFQSLNI